jgi:hypothetical protein
MAKTLSFKGVSGREPKEKLTVAVVRDAVGSAVDKIVLTVRSAYFYTFEKRNDRDREQTQLFVEFAEFEGYSLNCNKTQAAAFEALVNAGHLPSQADDGGDPIWEGARVPMYVRENEFEEKGAVTKSDKWYPVLPRDFKSSLAAYDKQASSSARKPAKKTGRR